MNATVNGSNCSTFLNSTAAKIGRTFAYCLILVVSLVGNSCIAIIVYKVETMRKPINLFIVSMAISDLLYPIFLFPRIITGLYVDSWLISGPLGQALCKLVPFSSIVSSAVSIQSLVLIAVDRFGAVLFPLRSPLISSKLCSFFIFATWIVAMAVFSPELVVFKLVKYQGNRLCQTRWSESFGESLSMANFFTAIYIVFFYVPIALFVILYSVILVKLWAQKTPGEQLVNAEERRAKRNRSVLKMAIAIVSVFVICWLPLSILNPLADFSWDMRSPNCDILLYWYIAWFMSVSNCAFNPCVCFICSVNYRQGLKRLLKCFG